MTWEEETELGMNTSDKESWTGDYFMAHLEKGELVMEPHCACGEMLNEEYFCETCHRQCRCLEIRCENEETLRHVQDSIEKHPGFQRFRVVLMDRDEKDLGG
jgi:hypothetical protein